MPLFRVSGRSLTSVQPSSFRVLELRERQDLQRLIREHLDAFGEDLLLIAEEYSLFEDSRRRIDLLALDRNGSLVVIELKRTDDGGHMELQALRYAAMVSTMSFEHLLDVYATTHGLTPDSAREVLVEWLADVGGSPELPDTVRIMLASQDFSTEVTTTVLWLNEHYNTDISCFRMTPYAMGNDVLLDIAPIIPLPEARDFQIQQRVKGVARSAAKAASADSRDRTKFDVTVGHESVLDTSKQNAVKFAVTELFKAGIDLATIRGALAPKRWLVTHPQPGESVKDAFLREYPARGTSYWFDLGITDEAGAWVMPRFGGIQIADHLSALAKAAAPTARMTWTESGSDDRSAT